MTAENLSLQQSAEIIGCSVDSIRNYIARGDLKASRIRGSRLIRIARADLDNLLVPVPSDTTSGE